MDDGAIVILLWVFAPLVFLLVILVPIGMVSALKALSHAREVPRSGLIV